MKKKNPLISIIIPIYQVEKYLVRCLESIINQTYENIEIILVDDGSKDNCPQICDEYMKKDKRIKVIHKKNGGLSDARNKGLETIKGSYVTFVDSDDYVEKDYIEYLYKLIKKYKTNLSVCASRAIYESGTIISQETYEEYKLTKVKLLEKMLYQENINVSTWGKLYASKLFNDIKFPNGRIFEDSLTTYKLIDKCDYIAVGLVNKYNYMIRENSILTGPFSEKKLGLIEAYDEMGDYLLKSHPELEKAIIRAKVYANFSTLRQMIYAHPRLKDKEKDIKKFILSNSRVVMHDKRAQRRDKFAIILLSFGIPFFKIGWTLYCKTTGRIYR